jgi:hypothetical protein
MEIVDETGTETVGYLVENLLLNDLYDLLLT